jgi:hypothetical protein
MLRPALLIAALSIASLPGMAQVEDGRPLARFRMDQLKQSVGLSEPQARTVVDRWARYDQDLFEKTRQIREIRHRFSDILLGPGAEEEKNARVKPLLEQFIELRRQQADLKLRFEDDIRARLSPAQQVRLIMHVEEMQRRVAEALRQGFGNRPGGRLGPRRDFQ